MKCEKCGGEWIPPKDISVSLMNCPFCGTPVLNAEKAKSYQDMGEFLQYLVSLYGSELYESRQKLNNLIADLYQGDERMKRVYRRAIFDDSLSKRIYDLSLRPLNEREVYYNQLVNQFVETNFYTEDFGKQVIRSLVLGLQLEIIPSISTKATEEDGEWIDEFGAKYSADRKKLIHVNESLKIKTYKIRDNTLVICDNAFLYCESLTSITIPSSVTSIGNGTFGGCKSLTNITIPSSVASIGNRTFWGCKSLTNITIPNSVTSIGKGAFEDCESLTNITIPSSVTSIGDWTFWGCESLTNITIPNSVTSIGEGVFTSCNNLHITLESNNHFIIKDNTLYTADMTELICCFYPKDGTILIPNSVTCIRDNAFSDSKSLTNITIPNSVTSIGDWAFSDCKSLTNITISNSVTSIGEGTFWGCESLTNITIPNSVTSIGDLAFSDCKSLTNITIPNSVTSIGEGVFDDCSSLKNIYILFNSRKKFVKLLPEKLHPLLKEQI